MAKSIIKEVIIILLLLVAIVLALGVLFYDYIPANKAVPIVATYSTSESIKTELNDQITEDETVLVTYEITSSDLNNYTKTKDYEKGKVNPFSTYQTANSDENSTNDKNNVTNTNSINTNTQSNSTKSNTFYNSTGTK